MDPARSLRNTKADLTASNYINRKKAQTIYNSIKTEAATGSSSNYNGSVIFTENNDSVRNFRSFKLRGQLILGNDICIPAYTSNDCS